MSMLALLLVGCSPDGGALAGEWIAAFYRSETGQDQVEGVEGAALLPGDTGGGDGGADDTGDTGDTGPAFEVLPACEGDVGAENFRAWLRIDQTQPVEGVHLSLYPDGPEEERPAASNGQVPSSAMAGLVVGGWEDGRVSLALVPDLDHALATDTDREAWRDHQLHLSSEVWGDRCWTARWAWVDGDGVADPVEQGVVFVRRQ